MRGILLQIWQHSMKIFQENMETSKFQFYIPKSQSRCFAFLELKKSQILQTIFGSQYLFNGSKFSSPRLLATSWRAAAFQTCGLFATMSRSTPALSLPLVLDAPQSRLSFQTHARSLRKVKTGQKLVAFFSRTGTHDVYHLHKCPSFPIRTFTPAYLVPEHHH